MAHRRRRRHPDPTWPAADRRVLRPQRGDGRGRAVSRWTPIHRRRRGAADDGHAPILDVKALIVAEYYPRAGDPVGGIWAHRQAIAARDAGADVRVLVLHRPVPPLSAVRPCDLRRATAVVGKPRSSAAGRSERRIYAVCLPAETLELLRAGEPGPRRCCAGRCTACARSSRSTWCMRTTPCRPATRSARRGSCAAGGVGPRPRRTGRRVRRLGGGGHAPARPARARQQRGDREAVLRARGARHARRAPRCRRAAARAAPSDRPTLVTVGHLAARKRHADVISALRLLRDRHPRASLCDRR